MDRQNSTLSEPSLLQNVPELPATAVDDGRDEQIEVDIDDGDISDLVEI